MDDDTIERVASILCRTRPLPGGNVMIIHPDHWNEITHPQVRWWYFAQARIVLREISRRGEA